MQPVMPLIKLSRINKGGEIVVNSDHILFIEIESKVTTVHMAGNLLFSVEEPLDSIAIKIEMIETNRIKNAIQQSGLIGKEVQTSAAAGSPSPPRLVTGSSPSLHSIAAARPREVARSGASSPPPPPLNELVRTVLSCFGTLGQLRVTPARRATWRR